VTPALAVPDRLDGSSRTPAALRLMVLAGTILFVATLAVFLVRFVAVVRMGDYYDAVCEGPPTYGIWKVQNGWPLYEGSDRQPYSVTLYNFGFYHLYANVLRVVGVGGSEIVLGGRLLSALFGLAGCFLTYRLIARLADSGQWGWGRRWLVCCLVFFLWFGSASVSWFAIAVRPDMASLAVATAALLVYAGRLGPATVGRCLVAALLFYVAWALKQSTVGILTGACLHVALCERRLKPTIALVVPCALLMAATLAAGGEDYRINVIRLPAISSFGWGADAEMPRPIIILLSLAANAFVWLYPLAGLAPYLATRRAEKPGGHEEGAPYVALSALVVPALVSSAWCFFAAFRDGSAKNTLLEGYLTTGALTATLLLRRLNERRRKAAWLEGVVMPFAVLAMSVFPLAQLAFFDRLGNLTIDSAAGYAKMSTFVGHMKQLPKPIFIEDSQLSLPWFSTDNRYPAYTLDVYLMVDAKNKGWYKDGGFDSLVRQRAFASLLLKRGLVTPQVAREAGYRREEFPPGVDSLGFELYRLPDGPVPEPEAYQAP
jgi:hypothetical protein